MHSHIHIVVIASIDREKVSPEQEAQKIKDHLEACRKEPTAGYFPEIVQVELVRR